MVDRSSDLEPANQADIAAMRTIVADAVRAGAFGVSTSRTTSHKSLKGDYTPTLRALEAELTGLGLGVQDAGSGFLEIVPEWSPPKPKEGFDIIRRAVAAAARECVISLAPAP